MNKLFNLRSMVMAAVGALFVILAVGSDEPTTGGSDPVIPSDLNGVVEVKLGIYDFDAAYAANQGFFCLMNDMQPTADNTFTTLTYVSPDLSDIVSIVARKDDNMPSQLVMRSDVVYFSFLNDNVLELLSTNGADPEFIESVAYEKAELPGFTTYKDDTFRSILGNVAELLATSSRADLRKYAETFRAVINQPTIDGSEYLKTLEKDAKGNYKFANSAYEWYKKYINVDFYNTIFLWTGKATFKVGGSSCTLSGTIWCPSGQYNEFGTYGIICDANPENLYVDKAEYKGTGYQEPNALSFDVDFRGFKPNTTYYYRAYYAFNDGNHGYIIPKYGNADDPVIYDNTVKSFTTGDNYLTVDVVMCIDVTGSMSSIISTVKANAIGFYDSFKACCDKNEIMLTGLNVKVISYRDRLVDTDWLSTSPTFALPTESDEYKSHVNALYASGGGDLPESGLEALMEAFNNEDWGEDDGYHRQVVILWTDATYLNGEDWSLYTVEEVENKWNSLPSGRRLILFAPNGRSDYNDGSWNDLDGWKNTIHVNDLWNGFNNFEYILESIIGELTSKAPARPHAKAPQNYFFQPNE